jgi:3-deoxy-manno-octulosonate cytidylyltransferase (CMP-KDO synthetase)
VCDDDSAAHQSGTDRIAEAAAGRECDIVVNLQADEPEIDPAYIDLAAGLLAENPDVPMATLLAPFETSEDAVNPNIVKCVTDLKGRALYFSRSFVPYDRQAGGVGNLAAYRRHLGIYAYRKDFLKVFTMLAPSPLEQCEKLEQLRALENGFSIITSTVEKAWDGVDTPEQYAAFVKRRKS